MWDSSAGNIAAAPDRYDFGKWADVSDLYFGRYAALVANQAQQGNYTNEGDWFDYSVESEDGTGTGNGHFDQITQRVWQFFGDYMQFWLTQTGYPENPEHAALDVTAGIGGLRADFAQGLPPQAWEYIINRTRSRKWEQQAGFKYSKFCPPVIDDGKLLVPTFDGQVDVYELN